MVDEPQSQLERKNNAMQLPERIRKGLDLYGDNMSPDEIAAWYSDEEYGYFELKEDVDKVYGYRALNDFHALKLLRKRRFKTCVALGCADGKDIVPLAPVVDRFIGIEPAEKWWRDEISGTPSTFMKPEISGDISLADASCDLVTSFGVLHHIPNVTHVVGEIARILQPGGYFVAREPLSSMGDWRKPRRGLTARERGIPFDWLDSTLRTAGLTPIRRRRVMFPVTDRLSLFTNPYNSKLVVVADWIVSELTAWNDHYWRDTTIRKLGPGSSFFVAVKR